MFAAPEHLQSQSYEAHFVSPAFMTATHESTSLLPVRKNFSFQVRLVGGLLLGLTVGVTVCARRCGICVLGGDEGSRCSKEERKLSGKEMHLDVGYSQITI